MLSASGSSRSSSDSRSSGSESDSGDENGSSSSTEWSEGVLFEGLGRCLQWVGRADDARSCCRSTYRVEHTTSSRGLPPWLLPWLAHARPGGGETRWDDSGAVQRTVVEGGDICRICGQAWQIHTYRHCIKGLLKESRCRYHRGALEFWSSWITVDLPHIHTGAGQGADHEEEGSDSDGSWETVSSEERLELELEVLRLRENHLPRSESKTESSVSNNHDVCHGVNDVQVIAGIHLLCQGHAVLLQQLKLAAPAAGDKQLDESLGSMGITDRVLLVEYLDQAGERLLEALSRHCSFDTSYARPHCGSQFLPRLSRSLLSLATHRCMPMQPSCPSATPVSLWSFL